MCDVTGPVKGRRPGRPAFFKAHATPRAANALPGPPTRHCSLAIQAEDCASGQIIVTHSNRNQCGLATHWVQQTGGWPSSGLTHGGDTLYTLYWIIARTGTRLLLSVSCALLRHLSGTLAVRCRTVPPELPTSCNISLGNKLAFRPRCKDKYPSRHVYMTRTAYAHVTATCTRAHVYTHTFISYVWTHYI